ncbi:MULTISPECIES: DUF2946 family protein [Achromobacter]|uniref:DUF2946 domain-containing protein n=1 Tax=Alcaligenes xylosoxydans xylosoxydans TaxID=85698 RepID=A0A424WBN5_ALCXX|nr:MULTISPECIES: DUF2946 family protein [Achromobacter]MBC9902733.1 DUF2946 family protein [Achromobacter xylosoxidans]MBD0868292.1 DUF2946 family protein [Achromobacter xylosoxidans]MDH1301513.1 DUF2946 family protein [Achromobacter sp. GD03932]QNP83163.1 DUF2946 family protein [Achromobacter xylosoxidans]RPJ90624.1 DUF2946 domain-containing protein [Achromobacter xylosoxidans]
MHASAHARRRWVALVAMALFVFQALIASSALAASGIGTGQAGVTTIVCTASGPRVVTLDADGQKQGAQQQHSGALPHCCSAGCAMLSDALPPAIILLAWLLPAAAPAVHPPAAEPHIASALTRLPQRSRAPPPSA